MTARVCGREAVNVPFAVLRVKANIFLSLHAFAAKAANVPFAVLRVTANAFITARVCGKSGKRAVCGFALYGECFNRARLRQKRQKCRYWHYIALYAYVEPYLTMGCTAPHFPRPTN